MIDCPIRTAAVVPNRYNPTVMSFVLVNHVLRESWPARTEARTRYTEYVMNGGGSRLEPTRERRPPGPTSSGFTRMGILSNHRIELFTDFRSQ